MRRVEKIVRPTRSRPVSCAFCRSRKLRCSRQFPCANCTSRGIKCDLDAATTAASIPETTYEHSGSSSTTTTTTSTFELDVLSRLQRLEDIVVEKGQDEVATQRGSRPSPAPPRKGDFFTGEQSSYSSIDFSWIEGEVAYPNSMTPLVSYELEFRTCSIKSAALSAGVTSKTISGKTPTRIVWLPLYEEAKQIVEKYLTEITYIHHVVHVPSVRALLEDLYRNLSNHNPVQLGPVNLLLAMLSSTTFFWTERDVDKPLFSSVEEANGQFTMWMRLALEVLEYSRRTRSDSLEDIQAMIIVCFSVCNVAGITSQARYLFSTANSVAWNLGLHRIDHPQNEQNKELKTLPPDTARAEIGRRVWWYLVATDWQVSQFSGPQKGIYTMHPHQMATNKPLNANDEDLVDGRMANVGKATTEEPTSMSYCLQRIRLGEICRETCDTVPFHEIGSAELHYRHTRDIDMKIREAADTLPSFFSLDFDFSKLARADPRRSPGLIIQRYIINSLLHAQRCRLHLPYLTRAATDPAYAYSRKACMEAARMVIRTERQLATEDLSFVLARLKFSGVLHCIRVAIIVLLMDLCRNKDPDSETDRESRVEIYNAFGILEEARGQSPFADKTLESFYAIIRRHNISLSTDEGKPASRQGNGGKRPVKTPIQDNVLPMPETNTASFDPSLPSFDDLWQTFDTNGDPSLSVDWNAVFAEMETPFLSM